MREKRWIIVGLLFFVFGCVASMADAQKDSSSTERGPYEGEEKPVTKEEAKKKVEKEAAQSGKREEKSKEAKQLVSSENFDIYWEDGLYVDSKDRNFKLRIGGWLMADWGFVSEDRLRRTTENHRGFLHEEDWEADLREARLITRGKLYDFAEFQIEHEFSEHTPDWKDVFFKLTSIPYIGNITVGHQKEPFSMDELIRLNNITFMERALPNAFAPGRNPGVNLSNAHSERLSWALGGFWETEDLDSKYDQDGPFNLTARITGLPWYDNKTGGLVHLGLSYSHKFIRDDRTVSFSYKPESRLVDTSLDTGTIPADGVDLVSFEAGTVFRSFSLQGEYMHSFVDSSCTGDPDFNGWYVNASYFLTGEHRVYDTSSGTFGFLTPKRPFDLSKRDWGAFEVALRYSQLDLNDAGIKGGRADDVTAGLNWYLSSNLRFMFNYVHSEMDRGRDADIVQFRLQIHFDSPAPFDVPAPSGSPASL